MFASSPVFHLRSLRVIGESHLREREVVRLAGVGPGTNVLWLRAGEVQQRLESSPWIARAVVTKSLPSTVRIEIHERTPVAVVQKGSGLLLIAGDGTSLGPVAKDPGLPLIVASSSLDSPSLGAPARALQPMDPGVRSRIEQVQVAADGTLELRLVTGTQIVYGPAADVVEKAAALRALLQWASTQTSPIASIDLTSPGAPTALLGPPTNG